MKEGVPLTEKLGWLELVSEGVGEQSVRLTGDHV